MAEDPVVVVRTGPDGGRRLVAARTLRAGEELARLDRVRLVSTPERYSLQVGASLHAVDLGVWRWLNHACAPSVAVACEPLSVVTLRQVDLGEELTLFYPATEWVMAEPFTCRCGASACVGLVAGASVLPAEVLGRHRLSPHVAELCRRRQA